MATHYAIVREDKIVTGFFSDDFQKPKPGNILIAENAGRGVDLQAVENYQYKYKIDSSGKLAANDKIDTTIMEYQRIERMIYLQTRISAGTILHLNMSIEEQELIALINGPMT